MSEDRACLMCGRPLPRRRWWQVLEPPPTCPPPAMPECFRLTRERLGAEPDAGREDWRTPDD